MPTQLLLGVRQERLTLQPIRQYRRLTPQLGVQQYGLAPPPGVLADELDPVHQQADVDHPNVRDDALELPSPVRSIVPWLTPASLLRASNAATVLWRKLLQHDRAAQGFDPFVFCHQLTAETQNRGDTGSLPGDQTADVAQHLVNFSTNAPGAKSRLFANPIQTEVSTRIPIQKSSQMQMPVAHHDGSAADADGDAACGALFCADVEQAAPKIPCPALGCKLVLRTLGFAQVAGERWDR